MNSNPTNTLPSYLLDVLGLDGEGTSGSKKGGENSELHLDNLCLTQKVSEIGARLFKHGVHSGLGASLM